jgi:glycosyltransferase involved in cell wall biosynthesis
VRVLSVSDFYPPIIGGMERHVQSLSRELVRRGHSVAVATLAIPGSPSEEIDEGVRVHRIAGFGRILKPFYQSLDRPFHPTIPDPGLMSALRKVFARERPDIVHARGWMIYSALPLKTKHGPGIIVNLDDYGLVCAKKTFVQKDHLCSGPAYRKCVRCAADAMGFAKALGVSSGLRLSSPLHQQADRFIAVSRSVAERSGGRAGTRDRPVDVIPTLVPDQIVDCARGAARPSFVPAVGDYLMFVGHLGRTKGLAVLLDALTRLRHRVPLVVIATPTLHDAPALPPDVRLVIGVEHEAVMAAWAHCTLAVIPSTWPEPFGQVAVEAMACGRAVVASRIGGLTDIVVHGETGLLVTPGDPTALAQALDELLGNRARRDSMGAAGSVRAPRFFASSVVPQIEAIYLTVLATRAGGRPSSAITSS